jgi:hypothetical protein
LPINNQKNNQKNSSFDRLNHFALVQKPQQTQTVLTQLVPVMVLGAITLP